MWTLALETTSDHGSVALLDDDRPAGERALTPRSYSTELFSALEAVLEAGGIALAQLDLIAVADGPGSFTGVRVGLTAAKGLVESLRKPALGVSTLRAVAAAAAVEGPVAALLDAQRGELYLGLFAAGAVGAAEEEMLLTPEAAGRRLQEVPGIQAFTPHAALAQVCQERWLALGLAVPAPRNVPPLLAVPVGRLARRARLAGAGTDALGLEARYIRRSDAEMHAAPRLD